MTNLSRIDIPTRSLPYVSPLTLSDQLLRLAEDADHAGFRSAAEHLVVLSEQVLNERAAPHI